MTTLTHSLTYSIGLISGVAWCLTVQSWLRKRKARR